MPLFPVGQVIAFGALAGVAAGLVLALGSWGRRRGRFLVSGVATSLGFIAWNLTLNATHATEFDTDAPFFPISWQDAGSGILAFTVVALTLGLLTERRQPASRVVGAAALAGLAAILVDLFVL